MTESDADTFFTPMKKYRVISPAFNKHCVVHDVPTTAVVTDATCDSQATAERICDFLNARRDAVEQTTLTIQQ
jgi:hypothetical protein